MSSHQLNIYNVINLAYYTPKKCMHVLSPDQYVIISTDMYMNWLNATILYNSDSRLLVKNTNFNLKNTTKHHVKFKASIFV